MRGYNRLNLTEPYRALIDLDATGFAWEWLRRNPDFRALWERSGVLAQRASVRALAAARRGGFTMLGRHPLATETAIWGLSFRCSP